MKLTAWLTDSKVSDAEFASRIGVSRQALWRYRAGDRIPKRDVMERIKAATGGAVTPADFYESQPREAAE